MVERQIVHLDVSGSIPDTSPFVWGVFTSRFRNPDGSPRAGAPALEITRHYYDAQDRLVSVSVGRYPSDRFSHNTTFRIQSEKPEEMPA